MAQKIFDYQQNRTEKRVITEAWMPRGGGTDGGLDGGWQFISVRELIGRIRRRALLISLFVFCATALVYKIVTGMTPLYESTSELILEPQNDAVLGLEQTLGFGTLDERAVQSKMAELRSPDFLEKIAEENGLFGIEEFNPPPASPPFWKSALQSVGILSVEPVDESTVQQVRRTRAVERLRDKISVELVGVSHVIGISVKSADPELAASLANNIANAYINIRLETRYRSAERTAEWFAEKVATLKSDVEASETAIATYRSENGLIETNQGDQISQQIAELTSQLVLAETERAGRETELRRLENLRGSPEQLETAISSAGNPTIQTIRDQILSKRSQIQQLASEFGENHPTLIAARSEMSDLQTALATELDRLIQDASDNLAVAESRENKLQEILDARRSDASISDQARVNLTALEREASAKRNLLEGFLNRQTEITAQEDFLAEKPEARVIATAVPGLNPVFPPTKLAVLGAMIGAFVFACLVAIFIEELDNTYHSADQLERMFPQLRVLGSVPLLGRSDRAPQKVVAAVVKSPETPYAESIRSLAGRLSSRLQSDPSNNVVLFTSAEPAEGKTSTIASTARQLALNNQKTVLIDCDLRRPALHKAFGVTPSKTGLISHLHDDVTLDNIVLQDRDTPLDVVMSGGRTRDVFPLISSGPMHNLVSELRSRYDVVLIDAPPVMAVDDVFYLQHFAGILMFCVRWGKTRRGVVDRAVKTLIDADPSLPIGLVLTRMDAVRHASYDYGDSGVYAGRNAQYYAN